MHTHKPSPDITTACAVFFLLCCGWLIFANAFRGTGWDYSQFYIAGSIPLESLYDRDVYEGFASRELAPVGVTYFPPYVRPAVFALPLKAFSPLSFFTARAVFFALQFVCYLVVLRLSFQRFGARVGILPLFALSYPALMGIITGQDPHTIALLAFGGLLLLEKNRDVVAGLLWSLCLYKFNLSLGLPLLLLVRGRYRALGSFVAGGAVLAGGSMLLAPPSEYLALLGDIERYTIEFSPANGIGLRAIALTLGIDWLYPAGAALVCGSGVVLLRRASLPVAYVLAILGSAVCSYHVNWYDAAILTPCFVFLLADGRNAVRWLPLALLAAFPLWPRSFWIACLLTALWAVVAVVEWQRGGLERGGPQAGAV